MYPYVTRMFPVCNRMYPYVSCVTRMLPVCYSCYSCGVLVMIVTCTLLYVVQLKIVEICLFTFSSYFLLILTHQIWTKFPEIGRKAAYKDVWMRWGCVKIWPYVINWSLRSFIKGCRGTIECCRKREKRESKTCNVKHCSEMNVSFCWTDKSYILDHYFKIKMFILFVHKSCETEKQETQRKYFDTSLPLIHTLVPD